MITSATSAPSAMGTERRSAEGRRRQHWTCRRARRAPVSSDGSDPLRISWRSPARSKDCRLELRRSCLHLLPPRPPPALSLSLAVSLVAAAFSASRSLFCSGSRTRRPVDRQHVRRPSVETDAQGERLLERSGGGRRLRSRGDLCQTRNAPAVRDHFPRLLESDVPEAVLLHILAPVPLAGHDEPAQQPARADVPARRTMPRASLAAAVEAMAPSRREATLAAIDANLLAASTRRAMESRVRTVATLAEAGEFALFPLDANKLHIIAGALRIGNYRSAGLYLDAVIWHQENRMHIPVSAALRRAAKTLTKAALRGLPGSRLKQAFDLDELAQLVAQDTAGEPFDVEHAVDVVVVATWFMLREIEIAGARVKDLIVTETTVSLDIPLHKTAQGGQTELTQRTFRCVCVSAAHPLCPRCAAWRHRRRILATTAGRPDDFLRRGPRQSRRRCSGWCSTRQASRPALSTSRAGPGSSGGRHLPGGERSGRSRHPAPRQMSDMQQAPFWQSRRASRPRRCRRPAHTHSLWLGPPALMDGHGGADEMDGGSGRPGRPAAEIPAVGLSAPEPNVEFVPPRHVCRFHAGVHYELPLPTGTPAGG